MKDCKALLAGSTGLVGGELLHKLLENDGYSEVHTVSRRLSGLAHPKLSEHIIDFDRLADCPLPPVDDVFCVLGSTIKQAGSKEAFSRVDFTYAVELAARARESGARQFLVISSIMANPQSGNFYLRVKGEMEEAVKAQGPEIVQIFRPSNIQGERQEKRRGEKSGQILAKLASPLLIGGLKKFRNISASTIAEAMIAAARAPGKGRITYESDAIVLLAELTRESSR